VLQAPDRRIAGQIAQGIAGRYAASVGATRLAVATASSAATAAGTPPSAERLGAWIAAASAAPPTVAVAVTGMGRDEVDLTAWFAASMGIVFLFLGVGAGARSLLTEQREGTLVRLLAAPVPSGSVMLGKAVSTLTVGVTGFAVLWAATSLLGASWGRPLPVAVLILATVFAITGITTLVAGFARTEAAADGAATTLAFLFALLGGSFVSPGSLPALLERLALLTPNGWSLRAFADLSADGAGVAEVWPAVVVLAAIGLATGAIGYGRLRRVTSR
jgi:ABC-2 type transport system permease protein